MPPEYADVSNDAVDLAMFVAFSCRAFLDGLKK